MSTIAQEESAADQFGQVEARGIDYIPPGERHGRPAELFLVWAASNINYLYILLGGTLVLFGLNIWQALAVVVVGNLFWAPIGLLATSGPAAGSPSSVVTRSMFGMRGNRVFVGVFSWPVFIAYEALNLAMGSLAGFALADRLGWAVSTPIKVALVIVTAAVTLAISVYGHATILRMSGLFTVVLTATMLVFGGYVLAHANFGFSPAGAVSGSMAWSTAIAGVTLIAASPLSWGVSADYARYLPSDASKPAIFAWTALGGFIPSVLLGWLGVIAASAVDMTDPQTTLAAILPSWFYPFFLLVILLGSVTNNVLTMYSSGLCLQAIGVPLRRSASVFIDGVLGVALASYALFVSNFIDALSGILELSVALLGPSITIYAIDVVLRHNRYDGHELNDETRQSPFWFTGGVNLAGFTALVIGTGTAALCLNTSTYLGPVASALNGADISTLVGPLVAIAVYVAMVKVLYPGHFAATSSPVQALEPDEAGEVLAGPGRSADLGGRLAA
jgi:nucleobase:cation symporter-1, NCS1 family